MARIVDFFDYEPDGPVVLTIGVFDGVHLGHRALIDRAVSGGRARGGRAAVVTFDPAPRVALRPAERFAYICALDERCELIAELGVDEIALLRFDREVADTPAGVFLHDLADRLGAVEVVCGPDFALGRKRSGTIPVLRELGRDRGLVFTVLEPVIVDGERVSSSRIRALIGAGEVAAAGRLLGRHPTARATVVRGAGRGRQLGVPTANLDVPSDRCVPANGIYAAWATLPDGRRNQAAVSIGVRPTFNDGDARTVEAHLLDFEGDLYGRTVTLSFVAWLRAEESFDSVDALLRQIDQDIVKTRDVLKADAAVGRNG